MGLRVKISSDETPATVATICDSPDPLPSFGFTLNNKRLLQVQDFFRADYVSVFGRRNRRNTVSFEVVRNTDGAGAAFGGLLGALLFAMDHGDEVPETGLIQFDMSDGIASASRWMVGGIENVELVKYKGESLFFRYSLVGSQLLKKNPNT